MTPTAKRVGANLQPAAGSDAGRWLMEANMNVMAILSHKGNNVATVGPSTTLGSAIKMLTERGIGALVVLGADHRVIGILSERDVVLALAERGATALTEPLASAMTRHVPTCVQAETVNSIMERMTTGKVRHMPVIEKGRLLGIVSIGDVVKHRVMDLRREAKVLQQEKSVLKHETDILHHESEVLQDETDKLRHETDDLREYIQKA